MKKGIWAICKRELGRMTSRPLYLLSMVCAPLFCLVFFTSLMNEGLPESLPAGVVDEDNTSVTRQILRNLDSFQQTEIVRQYSNFSDARDAVQRGEIYGFFYIPDGTTEKALRSERPRISLYTNGAYLIPSSLLYRDMKTMAEYASAAVGRETLLAKGKTMEQAMGFLQPIQMDMRPISNPWLNYSVYLNNTLVPAIMVLIIFIVTSFSIYTELKDETNHEWMAMADGNMVKALCGKLLPQFVVFFLLAMLNIFVFYRVLDFPDQNGMWPMILANVLLIIAAQWFGVFLCSMIPSMRWALSLSTLWGVLSIPISGFSFPVMAMPPALQALSWFFPMRYYFLIYVDQALNGRDFACSAWYYMALLGFIVLGLSVTKLLKRTMTEYVYIP